MARCSQDVTGVCMSVLCLDFMLSVGPFSRLYESCVFFGVGFCGVWSWAGFADTVSPGRQFHEVAGYVIPPPPLLSTGLSRKQRCEGSRIDTRFVPLPQRPSLNFICGCCSSRRGERRPALPAPHASGLPCTERIVTAVALRGEEEARGKRKGSRSFSKGSFLLLRRC